MHQHRSVAAARPLLPTSRSGRLTQTVSDEVVKAAGDGEPASRSIELVVLVVVLADITAELDGRVVYRLRGW